MSTNQSWGGRFAEGPREAVAAYTDSQTYDRALYAQDIRGSQAHARMLGRQGVITPDEAEQIVNGLDAVKQEIESGAFVWKPALEDVHMNIEARLTEIIGDVGKKLHTGRSRNDQVALDIRLNLREASLHLQGQIKELILTICDPGRKIFFLCYARLHPSAACPAGHLWPPTDGLRLDAAARPGPHAGRHRPHGR